MLTITPNDIRLTIDGKTVTGATEISLRRGLYNTASALSITAPAISALAANWIYLAGSIVKLHAHNTAIFTGIIDEVSASFTTTESTAEQTSHLAARSLTAIMVDSTMPRIFTDSPQETPLTILDWAKAVAGEFGIGVSGNDYGAALATGVEPSLEKTADEFLRELAARRLTMLTDDGDGNLRVLPAQIIARKSSIANIKQDLHLTEASVSASQINKFRTVAVRYDDGENSGEVISTDKDVKQTKRRNVIVAKNQMTAAEAQALADYYISRQKNDFAVSGKFSAGIWIEPGDIINLDAPAVGINGNLVITECDLSISGTAGISSTFVGVPPRAAIPAPIPREQPTDTPAG